MKKLLLVLSVLLLAVSCSSTQTKLLEPKNDHIKSVDGFWQQELPNVTAVFSQQLKAEVELERQSVTFSPDFMVALLSVGVSFNQKPIAVSYLLLIKPEGRWSIVWGTIRLLKSP